MNKLPLEIKPHEVIKYIDKSLLAIDDFDFEKLNSKEREEIYTRLSDIEKIALELKTKFAD